MKGLPASERGRRAVSGRRRGWLVGRFRVASLASAAVTLSVVMAHPAMASGPLIVGNNAAFGGGPIQTYDFSAGGPPVASFVPTGASGTNNGRGLEVIGSEVFYTELSGNPGATDFIRVAPYNGGAGGPDTRTLPNPRPLTGVQDLAASSGLLNALTGYPGSPLQVFKLDPLLGVVLAGPISIASPASPSSDGFTVLPNGNFLINNFDQSCKYNQYNGLTGALVSGTTITVPGAGRCTGVDTNGTSLFFQTNFQKFTQTDLSGNLVATQTVSGNAVEDISLIQPSAAKHPTTTTVECEPKTVVAGQPTKCTATVTDTATSGQTTPTGTVNFTTGGPGSFSNASCKLSGSGASATCSVTYTPGSTPAEPVRKDTITATYEGDGTHEGSKGTTTVTVISPTALAHGSFVIGDKNAVTGKSVTYYDVEWWGSDWWKRNSLSGGRAPSAFKGFAETASSPPECNKEWTTNTGNSSGPPATVPEYMEVIGASKITQSGSTIKGNAPKLAVVKTNPGYLPDPGHKGTGKVVAVIECE